MLCVSWLYSMVGGWPDVRIIIIVVVEYKNNEITKKWIHIYKQSIILWTAVVIVRQYSVGVPFKTASAHSNI